MTTPSHIIVKTTSHRAYRNVERVTGAVGPYWKESPKNPGSIMDRVNGEFWLVPYESAKDALRIAGVTHAKTAKPEQLGRLMFSTDRPAPAKEVMR